MPVNIAKIIIPLYAKGLFARKTDFALGLQVYNTTIYFYTLNTRLLAKSCSEIGR